MAHDDNDPILNCVLAVCCPPGSVQQRTALASHLIAKGLDANIAEQAATIVLDTFDLAQRGTLQPFKNSIERHARGASYQPDDPKQD